MVNIEILTAPGCSKCEQTVREVEAIVKRLSEKHPEIVYKTIDISVKPEVATKYGLLTTPAVAINGKLEFRGVPSKAKFSEKIEALVAQVPS